MNFRTLSQALVIGGKTALLSSVVGCICLLIYSLAVVDKTVYLPAALMTVALVSVLLGALRAGTIAITVGWLHGVTVAVLYIIVVSLIKQIMFPNAGYQLSGSLFAAVLVLMGSIGGIAGINLKFRRRRGRRYVSY